VDDYRQRVLAAAFWRGQAGLSERAVLLAMQEVAWQANSLIFSSSQRQLAERASKRPQTVRGAIGRLVARGLVERPEGEERAADKALTYRLVLDHPLLPSVHSNRPTSGSGAGQGPSGAVHSNRPSNLVPRPLPLFRHGTGPIGVHSIWDDDGLGRTALVVFEALGRVQDATVAALTSATGLHRNIVRKHLHRLAEHELAAHHGYVWVRLERDLDKLAAELGAGKLRQRRREQHQREREGHQRHLARQAELRAEVLALHRAALRRSQGRTA
jgi:DNA-binding MarR family transcriptional regulator